MEPNNTNDLQDNKSYSKLQRGLASLALLVIAALVIALIYFLITGNNPNMILMILFCLIVIPCLIYILIWFVKLINK